MCKAGRLRYYIYLYIWYRDKTILDLSSEVDRLSQLVEKDHSMAPGERSEDTDDTLSYSDTDSKGTKRSG